MKRKVAALLLTLLMSVGFVVSGAIETSVYAADIVDPGAAANPGYIVAGSCVTSYAGSSSNRVNNIQVGAARLNGMTLAPGQMLSIDAAILPRTTANGYKTAGVYSGGKTIQGVGGGICQISSTVYNAAMNAGLTIVKRYPHSMPVHYLPLGQDAAISSGSKDLVIMNPYDTPVVIATSCDASKITVSILAQAASLGGKSYRFYAVSKGSLAADTYRDVYLNGALIGTEYVGHSAYSAPSN